MNQATQPGQPPSDDERARRKKAVDYARGSVRLEGFVLDEVAEALFASYVNGEIDRPELDAAVAQLDASYG
jgi:Antitoxin VbhA